MTMVIEEETLQKPDECATLDRRQRMLLLGLREALLIALRAIETYLGMEVSRPSRRQS
jgi:hypothetical protein